MGKHRSMRVFSWVAVAGLALVVACTSANAGIVFQANFDGIGTNPTAISGAGGAAWAVGAGISTTNVSSPASGNAAYVNVDFSKGGTGWNMWNYLSVSNNSSIDPISKPTSATLSDYTLSFDAKAEGLTSGTTMFEVDVIFQTATANVDCGWLKSTLQFAVSDDGAWHHFDSVIGSTGWNVTGWKPANLAAVDRASAQLITMPNGGNMPTSGFLRWDNVTVTQVPEPMTLTLLALGGLGMLRRRNR